MVLSSQRSVFAILVLWLAGLGAAAQFAKIAVPFPLVRDLYPEAGSELGWLLSIISFVGVLFGMTAGVIISRLGSYRLLLLALLFGMALSFWQAMLPGLSLMLVSRVIEGASHLIIVVAAPTLIAQVCADRYRGLAMTLWSTFFGVSFAVVAWIGLPFATAYGLSGLFVTHGLFLAVVAGLLVLSMGTFAERPPANDMPFGIMRIWRQHIAAYRSPSISAPGIGWLFYTLTFVALIAILPDMLPEESRRHVTGLMPLASIAVALLVVAPLLAVVSATTIVMAGFILAIAVLAFLTAGMSPPLASILLFAVLGLVQGASFAAVPELNDSIEAQALSNGAIAQLGNLGNCLGTPMFLLTLGSFGLTGLLIAVMAVYVIGCIAHAILAYLRQRKRYQVKQQLL